MKRMMTIVLVIVLLLAALPAHSQDDAIYSAPIPACTPEEFGIMHTIVLDYADGYQAISDRMGEMETLADLQLVIMMLDDFHQRWVLTDAPTMPRCALSVEASRIIESMFTEPLLASLFIMTEDTDRAQAHIVNMDVVAAEMHTMTDEITAMLEAAQ
ncbi:MAG: hypothetical protein JW966_12540 [Anaerolineae bacterium]|nr:hypothetical protein [Anaerolineae bacterium]